MGSYIGRSQSPPILYGNLVSAVEQLEDLQGNKGLFFLFPDVSIRWRGRYQLGVTLSRISKYDVFLHILIAWLTRFMFSVEPKGTLLTQTRTRAFDAVALHQYRAARVLFFFSRLLLRCWTIERWFLKAQTRLTQSFLRQGARMFLNMQYFWVLTSGRTLVVCYFQ